MMSDVIVSINCITYNHEDYIADAIEGFLMQETNFKYEILIHDDASTDSTADIIREYEKKYPNLIKPIYQTENQYSKDDIKMISYTFNHTRAKGKYVAICEGDDYWTDPKKLQKQVDYMEEHSDCAMTFHAAEWIYVDDSQKDFEQRSFKKSRKVTQKELIEIGGGIIPTASMVFKKKFLDDIPDFFFESPTGDEVVLLILAYKGYGYYFNDIMSVHLKNIPGSWTIRTRKNKKKIFEHSYELTKTFEKFNKYSNYKFGDILNPRIALGYLNVFYNYKINNFFIDNKETIYKKTIEYYGYLNLKSKIRVYILKYFKFIYKPVKRVYNFFRAKNTQ